MPRGKPEPVNNLERASSPLQCVHWVQLCKEPDGAVYPRLDRKSLAILNSVCVIGAKAFWAYIEAPESKTFQVRPSPRYSPPGQFLQTGQKELCRQSPPARVQAYSSPFTEAEGPRVTQFHNHFRAWNHRHSGILSIFKDIIHSRIYKR